MAPDDYPYGYKSDPLNFGHIIEHDEEQSVLRDIAELKAMGLSIQTIVLELLKRGLPARKNNTLPETLDNVHLG